MGRPQAACGHCGAPAPLPFRAPAPELAPDLDLRPGEPTRSTLSEWVHVCRRCGACAPDLSALPAAAEATIRSPAYLGVTDHPPGVARFLRWAMLAGPAERAEALLQAAWVADDAPDDTAARNLRLRAAEAWSEPKDAESALRLIDVLRRAGAAARAEAAAAALEAAPLDENSSRILAFQRARLAAGDAGRHLLSSALRPPARMPHVARAKPKAAGFWSKLLGSG
jgi:hypothetical protein